MRKRIWAFSGLLCAGLAAASMSGLAAVRLAQADGGHPNADLRGTYSFTDTGKVGGQTYLEVGTMTADGAGHITSVIIGYLEGGSPDPRLPVGTPIVTSCTYRVEQNGLGTALCSDPLGTNMAFTLGDNGKEVRFIVRNSNGPTGYMQLSGTGRRQ